MNNYASLVGNSKVKYKAVIGNVPGILTKPPQKILQSHKEVGYLWVETITKNFESRDINSVLKPNYTNT